MKNIKSHFAFGTLCVVAMIMLGIQFKSVNYLTSWIQGFGTFSFFNQNETQNEAESVIQLALLLDTSSSMNGLIEQTKSQLWRIVSELSRTDQNGKTPKLEVALYEYGNSSIPAQMGHIRQLSPFTSDIDLVSQKLFSLTTNGGDEFCGQVIQTALNELKWNNNAESLRLIYIAGNEPFTQGPIPFDLACRLAKTKDVVINTIFCGAYQEGTQTSWARGASIAGGEFASIDHNETTVYTQSPYDEEITRLNSQLNTTYIPYGKEGHICFKNVSTQDNNAASYNIANIADRAVFKSSKQYTNDKWDLVDAMEKDKAILKNKKALPKELQEKSEAEITATIKTKKDERAAIQQQIQELDKKRRVFLKANVATQADSTNLQNSILKSVKKQAKEKGYKIKE